MRTRINPNQIVLGLVPKTCKECLFIQHVFCKTQEEYDAWECPECRKRLEDGDNPEPETES